MLVVIYGFHQVEGTLCGLAFRFKTTGHPSSSYGGKFYSQSLAVKKSNGTNGVAPFTKEFSKPASLPL